MSGVLRDMYMLEFLNLPEPYKEYDLQKAILKNMKKFLVEFGRDFLLVDEEYHIQVGNNDYYVDLLFYHRELQCLVAIDLKIDDFKPEYLGKIDFYLEALDRDVKKPHENPSVGMILCKNADTDVVEYSLSRSLYYITDWLGLVPFAIALGFAILGLAQWIKCKSLFKVDSSIFVLGVFYIFVMEVYLFFKKIVINYRPVLVDGFLEASYPSSTTMLALCVISTAMMQLDRRIRHNKAKNCCLTFLRYLQCLWSLED